MDLHWTLTIKLPKTFGISKTCMPLTLSVKGNGKNSELTRKKMAAAIYSHEIDFICLKLVNSNLFDRPFLSLCFTLFAPQYSTLLLVCSSIVLN